MTTFRVGFNYKGGGQMTDETRTEDEYHNHNAFVGNLDDGIGAIVRYHETGEIEMLIEDTAKLGRIIRLWTGVAIRLPDGRIGIRPSQALGPFNVLSEQGQYRFGPDGSWEADRLTPRAIDAAIATLEAKYQPTPDPVAELLAEGRGETREEAEAVITARESRADHRPDPLAAFRNLEPDAPLYDRASGREVGTFRKIASSPIGESIEFVARATGHIVWSSGPAITPQHPAPVAWSS